MGFGVDTAKSRYRADQHVATWEVFEIHGSAPPLRGGSAIHSLQQNFVYGTRRSGVRTKCAARHSACRNPTQMRAGPGAGVGREFRLARVGPPKVEILYVNRRATTFPHPRLTQGLPIFGTLRPGNHYHSGVQQEGKSCSQTYTAVCGRIFFYEDNRD